MSDKKETLQLLRSCQLHTAASSLERWWRNPHNLKKSSIECVNAMARDLAQIKAKRRTEQFLHRAGFPPSVSLANVWVGDDRGLPQALWGNLKSGLWLDEGITIVIYGEHGAGKSFLSAALARHALLTRQAVRYTLLSNVLDRLQEADAVGRRRLRSGLINASVLVIDQVAEEAVVSNDGPFLRDILEERQRRERATILVSSRDPSDWEHTFENYAHGRAITERLMNHALLIRLCKIAPHNEETLRAPAVRKPTSDRAVRRGGVRSGVE